MKHRIYRYIVAALFLILSFPTNSSFAIGNEIYAPSAWAIQKIGISKVAGIIPEDFDTKPFNQSITRSDFCELLINTCSVYGISLPEPPLSPTFLDSTEIHVEQAYLLGLTQGTTVETFSPELPLTREMAAVMLSRLRMLFQYTYSNNGNTYSDNLGVNRNYNSDGYDNSDSYFGSISVTSTGSLTYNPPMDEEEASKKLSKYASDSNLLSSWARAYMADVYTRGILLGTGEGNLDPKSNITREQAVILSLNVITYCDEDQIRSAGVNECVLPMPTGIYISNTYYRGDVYLSWNDIPLASAYDITIYKNGEPSYSERIDRNYIDLRTSSSNYNHETKTFDITELDNPLYAEIFGEDKQKIYVTLKVVPVDSNGEPSIFSLTKEFIIMPWADKNERIFGASTKNSFSSGEEAILSMKNIQINIWKLTASGTKTSATITLTVNKNVAEDVQKIFEEIYNGKEKFPIKSCGAYAFRPSRSEHSSGTAIDINYEENYFVGWDGTIKVGSLWEPGVNPYSIPPDGDVVRAFNKYGWHWSPDMHWSNGADYMHFSLGGT